MWRSRVVLGLAAVAVLGLVGPAYGQPGGRQGRQGRTGRGDPNMMQQFRQQAMERLKTSLGFTNDEEWKAVEPKVEKIQTLSRELQTGGMMFGGGRGNRGGAAPGGNGTAATPQSELQTKFAELQRLCQGADANPADVKAALAAYREARNKIRDDLKKAQEDLKSVLTPVQEAKAVVARLLE